MRKIGVLVVMLVLASCGGNSMTCTSSSDLSGGHASCTGTIDTLDARHLLTFNLDDVAIDVSIDSQFTVSIMGGTMTVAYLNREGQTVISRVVANQPLTIRDVMRLEIDDEVRITLEPVGGTVTGVSYTAEFTR